MDIVRIIVKGMVNMILDKKEKRTTPASKSSLCQNDALILTENNVFVKMRC